MSLGGTSATQNKFEGDFRKSWQNLTGRTIQYPSNFQFYYCSLYRRWGGGLHWRDTRATALAAASSLLLYRQTRESHPLPPGQLAGALTYTVSGDRDPQWQQTIDIPQRGRVDTTVFGPIQSLGVPASPASRSLLVYEILYPCPPCCCGCTPWRTLRASIYLPSK